MYRLINYLFWILSAALILAVAPAIAEEYDVYYPYAVGWGHAKLNTDDVGIYPAEKIYAQFGDPKDVPFTRGLFEYDTTSIPLFHTVTKAVLYIEHKASSEPLQTVEIYTYPGGDGIITFAEATDLTGATLAGTLTAGLEWDNATIFYIDVTSNIADLISSGDRYPGFILKLADETTNLPNRYVEINKPEPIKSPGSLRLVISHVDPTTPPPGVCTLSLDCHYCCDSEVDEPTCDDIHDLYWECLVNVCEWDSTGMPGIPSYCSGISFSDCFDLIDQCTVNCKSQVDRDFDLCLVEYGCLTISSCADYCESSSDACDLIALCGNGNLTYPEHCDDNNTIDGDNCSSICEAETTDPVNIVIDDNGGGSYDYTFQNPLDNETTTEILNNNGLLDLIAFDYRYDGNQTDGVVGLSTKNLPLADTTKSIILPWQLNLCAVDEDLFIAGSFDWNLCGAHPNRIIWSPFPPFNNGCESSPKSGRDKDLTLLPAYTCETFFDNGTVYARLSGFTHTTVIGANEVQCIYTGDSDLDGICDDVDNCKDTCNPSQLDADGDGTGDLCDNPEESGCGGGCSCSGCEPDCEVECIVDSDNDGIPDADDNCPDTPNSGQEDIDGDGIGDVCDDCTDTDNDGYGNPGYPNNIIVCPDDNCPDICNSQQLDADGDNIGDVCDPDDGCGGCSCGNCEPDCETEC